MDVGIWLKKKVHDSLELSLLVLMPTVMQTGLEIPMTGSPPQVLLFYLKELLFHGVVRSNLQYLDHLLKLNIVVWPILPLNSNGCFIFLHICILCLVRYKSKQVQSNPSLSLPKTSLRISSPRVFALPSISIFVTACCW
ncbi:hypothetical protein RchiOBHm_Chr4g0396511 [Rosa chinensis]|uniref:Uncharacterized protein n=1 Tax=Rosa chinensis TaxID=74649 RepID=A0A2P6QRV8_ROSCH|nr:hypothetical protein RchiOBHm_Chr4g0396511 [Rosa chinensis]